MGGIVRVRVLEIGWYLWSEIVDIGASHTNQLSQVFDLCGHIGRVHANLHHSLSLFLKS